jgi:hypothetical protein
MRLSRRPRLSIQPLEPREMPAGVVGVSFANGLLTLIGDDLSNTVYFGAGTDTGGSPVVRLTPDAGTAIDDPNDSNPPVPGAPITLPGTPTALRADLKGGSDVFRLLESALVLPGGADFYLGNGDNLLDLTTVQALQLGALTVTAGDGLDQIFLRSPAAAGSGITPGPRQDQAVKFALGTGGYFADLQAFSAPGRGGLSLLAGDGQGTLNAIGLAVAGPVAGRLGGGSHSWFWGGSSTGSLSVVGSGPGTSSELRVNSSTIAGNVNVAGSSSAAFSAFDTTIGGSVTVKKTAGPTGGGVESDLNQTTVGGSVALSAAGGSLADLFVVDSRITGAVAVTNTWSNGRARLTGSDAQFDGDVRVRAVGTGDADADVVFKGDSRARSLTVYGTDHAHLILDGRLTVVHPTDPTKWGDVRLTAGQDNTSVAIEQGELAARHLSISGADDAELNMDAATVLRLAGNLLVASGDEAEVFGSTGDATVDVAGTVAVRGSSWALLEINGSWSSGKVAVSSTSGDASMVLDGTTVRALGDVTLQGSRQSQFFLEPSSSAGMGSLRVTGGAGDDFVQVNRATLQGIVNLNLGNGDNTVDLMTARIAPHPADPRGNLTVTTGTGSDTVRLSGVDVAGATSIKTGAGKDALTVEQAWFAGTVQAELGAGDDVLDIAQPSATGGEVRFESAASLATGAGNDRLRLGLSFPSGGSTKTAVVFEAAGNRIDGGTGADELDPERQQAVLDTDATLTVTSWEVDP